MWQFWLVISGVFFIIEMITIGFLVFWLGVGAILACIVSLFTDSIIIQTAVFVISSIILIFLTKPLVKKFSSKDNLKTNAYSIIGKKGIVIKDISSESSIGQVKVSSEVWSAVSESKNAIAKNTKVEVVAIDGVKVIVRPVKVAVTK